jgi:LuxR family maltose regulon positive regulatory protein
VASLSSPTAVVLLVGPHGSGKTVALASWASGRGDVDWVVDGRIPDRESGYLVIDDADSVDDATWRELDRRLEACPRLWVRAAALTADHLPGHWDVEVRRDLYLDHDEVVELVEGLGSPADPAVVASITRGHAGSTRFLARSGASTRQAMYAALAGGPAPDGTEEIPTELAVPQYLTRDLARQLAGGSDVLSWAESRGLGGFIGGPSSPVFALTPGVRARARADEADDRERRLEIRARAAESLLSEGAHLEAIAEAVASHRLAIAERAIMKGVLTLVATYPREIEVLLRGIPLTRLTEHPVLAASLGLVMHDNEARRPRAKEVVKVAGAGLAGFSARAVGRRGSGTRALIKALEAMVMRVMVTGDEGVEAARKAADMIEGLSLEERDALGAVRGIAMTNLALVLMYGGRFEEARELAVQGLDVPESSAEALLAVGTLALLDVLVGRMSDARRTLLRADHASWPERLMSSHAGDFLRIARAWEAVERSDVEAARPDLEVLARRADTSEHWHVIAHVRALYDIEVGDVAAGIQRLRAAYTLRADKKSVRRSSAHVLEISESLLYLAAGEHAKAAAALRTPGRYPRSMLAAARVAVMRGMERDAYELLADVSATDPRDVMTGHVLRAVLLERAGRHVEARRSAHRAVAVGTVNGLRTPIKYLTAKDQELFAEYATDMPALVAEVDPAPTLTPRERIVAEELRGRGTEIAERLHVSTNTVKSQTRALYRKLGATTREEAIVIALALGVLED